MIERRLVGDAGGTNVRFAITGADGTLTQVRTYQVADYPTFTDALEAYRSDADEWQDISAAAIAAAGPIDGDRVKLTNNTWCIDRVALSEALAGVPVVLVNDLEAVAAALPALSGEDFTSIGGPPAVRPERRTMLAVNVGTGFGAASVIQRGGRWWTNPSEAGHMTLGRVRAEATESESTVESVLSGAGLVRLHQRLLGNVPLSHEQDAGEVLGRSTDDAVAAKAVGQFTAVLARVAGDLALATCAWGGVYLCGTVALAWSAIADHSLFRAEFTRKGPMQGRMRDVPTVVIRRHNVALFGLAIMPIAG